MPLSSFSVRSMAILGLPLPARSTTPATACIRWSPIVGTRKTPRTPAFPHTAMPSPTATPSVSAASRFGVSALCGMPPPFFNTQVYVEEQAARVRICNEDYLFCEDSPAGRLARRAPCRACAANTTTAPAVSPIRTSGKTARRPTRAHDRRRARPFVPAHTVRWDRRLSPNAIKPHESTTSSSIDFSLPQRGAYCKRSRTRAGGRDATFTRRISRVREITSNVASRSD